MPSRPSALSGVFGFRLLFRLVLTFSEYIHGKESVETGILGIASFDCVSHT